MGVALANNELTTKIDHRGFTVGVGKESGKSRRWVVLDAGLVVATGTAEQKGNNRGIFSQAIEAAQAAIDQRLDGEM